MIALLYSWFVVNSLKLLPLIPVLQLSHNVSSAYSEKNFDNSVPRLTTSDLEIR